MSLPVIALSGRMGSGKDTVAAILQQRAGYVSLGLADALKRFCGHVFSLPYASLWGSSEERNVMLATPVTKVNVEQVCFDPYGMKSVGARVHALFGTKVDTATAVSALHMTIAMHAPIETSRRLLQIVGTDWGRALHDEVWLDAAKASAVMIAHGLPYFRADGALSGLKTRLAPSPVVITDCRFPNEARYLKRELGAKIVWIEAGDRVKRDERFASHASEPEYESMREYVDEFIDNSGSFAELEGRVSTMRLRIGAVAA